jgi:ComF family protein
MTSLLERAISIIAPHHCICCGKESNILCVACHEAVFIEPPDVCFLCNKPTVEARVCQTCRPRTVLEHVWTAATYDGIPKRLIQAYKFERLRGAYKPLATAMINALPYLEDVVVVHVPTAQSRVRQRGYDQSKLLAQEIARQQGWMYKGLLRRLHHARQVGSSRAQRFKQAQSAFGLAGTTHDLSGRHILLVDDVTTSGATLTAAAQLLMEAGAARIEAVTVAKHTLE